MPVTWQVQSNPQPFVSSDIWASLDGRANAPAGTPQYPTLLNAYPPSTGRVRTGLSVVASQALGNGQPPWMVAGVDYLVGPPAGQSFIDPSVSPPAGTSFSIGGLGAVLTVNSPNVVIDGYDFSLPNSGAGCAIASSQDNLSILRSNFNQASTATGGGGAYIIAQSGNGLTMKYCTMDGGALAPSSPTQSSLIKYSANAGTVTFQYNWFKNYIQHVIELVDTCDIFDARFNLYDDSPSFAGSHYNWLQFGNRLNPGGSNNTLINLKFNGTRQVSLGGAEGWQTGATNNQDIFIVNNCMVSKANGGAAVMSNFTRTNDQNNPTYPPGDNVINGSANEDENYIDVSGCGFHISNPAKYNVNADMPPRTPGGTATWTVNNNVDMLSGRFIDSNGLLI